MLNQGKINKKGERMKRKLLYSLILLLLVGMTACGKTQESEKKETENTEDTENTENSKEEDTDPQEPSSDEAGTVQINIYSIDSESGEMTSQMVEVPSIDAQVIWGELQKTGIVSNETAVLGLETTGQDGSMVLDLNKAFGEQLRSMGTTGENEIMNSIVYTYLEAFQCDKIKITEEGGTLYSGHKEYTEYLEKR